MTITTIASAVAIALASFVPASCHTINGKSTAHFQSATNDLINLDGTNCFLGDLMLTNHMETIVKIGQNKKCFFTTRMIDHKNAQITLALECKETNSKTGNLSVTQIVAKQDKPFELALGNCSLSFTPHIVSE